MSISHLRVAARLALAFGVVCLVMSLSAAVGIWRLAGLQDIADDLGGASSERVALSDFKIRKAVDKASAKLFEHCCTGKHIAKLKLNVNRAGGDKVTYLTIDMEEVVVSSVKFVAGGNQNGEDKAVSDLPVEEISFNFARIKTTYTQQNRTDGQAGGNIVGGWDRTANKVFA